jgi:hypothetical protein
MLNRLVLGLTTLFVSPHRIPKLSAIIKPATLLKFHRALVHRNYRLLFSSSPLLAGLPPARKKLTCSDCATDSPVGPQAWLMSRAVSVPQRSQDRRVV